MAFPLKLWRWKTIYFYFSKIFDSSKKKKSKWVLKPSTSTQPHTRRGKLKRMESSSSSRKPWRLPNPFLRKILRSSSIIEGQSFTASKRSWRMEPSRRKRQPVTWVTKIEDLQKFQDQWIKLWQTVPLQNHLNVSSNASNLVLNSFVFDQIKLSDNRIFIISKKFLTH